MAREGQSSWRIRVGALRCAPVVFCCVACCAGWHTVRAADHGVPSDWSAYESGVASNQYSPLKQIDKTNVGQLQQAWFYSAAGAHRFECSPIIIDGVMYVIGKGDAVVALDASTGQERWVHDTGKPRMISERGLTYWASKDGKDQRILFSSDNILRALDARTGKSIDSFGKNGGVDLREGLGRDIHTIREIESGTPGRIFENLLVLGATPGEEYGSPPGDIRAFDVVSGKLMWTFHTIPHPGEMGYETWPKDAWKYVGGTNAWGGITIDEKRGIAYFPTGSPTYDFYGADRWGANLFSDCVLALDARTGRYLWHFQIVHHDLWDYDLATAPKLVTVNRDGHTVDAVAAPGKTGFLYVLDRVTGKPIWPIEERPVPQSHMPGEQSWPTQPFPTAPAPFAVQHYTADDVNPYLEDAAERSKFHDLIAHARNEGMFTPPGLEDTLQSAGNNGGSNWGNAAVDPVTNTLYVQSKNAPAILKLAAKRPRFPLAGSPASKGQALYIQNCQMCHTAQLTGQPPAVPSLVDIVSRAGADHVRSVVTNGASPMPSFAADFSSEDLDSLIAYLQAPASSTLPPDVAAYLAAPPPPPASEADHVRYWSGYGFMAAKDGLPAVKPPWSVLTAYDMSSGAIRWQVPLGGIAELEARGIRDTGGYFPQGGPAVTAGGLIFDGDESDFTMRAYDKDTGKVLWEHTLPATPHAEAAVYSVNGREFLVQAALPKPMGSSYTPVPEDQQQSQGYYVFALPKQ